MGLWQWYKNYVKRKSPGKDQQDVTFPESKGKITLKAIQSELKDIATIQMTEIQVNEENALMIYDSTMVDKSVLQRIVLDPLLESNTVPLQSLKLAQTVKENELPRLITDILKGNTALLFFEKKKFVTINTYSPPSKSITYSQTESTVLGPQDSFTESLDTSLSLIKRRISSPNLKHKQLLLGTESRSTVAVLYMGNIANEENVKRVLFRLQNVEYDGINSASELKQILEDKPYSPFPQFNTSQRPDAVYEALLDGRVIVMVNGSPEAIILPVSFLELFFSPEDFYNRWTTATLLRIIRIVGFIITILLTSTYVSVLTFHPEMLPPVMLTLLAQSRTHVPFPPVIEVLLMEFVIEILRESSARLPEKIGTTIGIAGGIVIGTAAVDAGLASNVLIVIVAISALLSFLPPSYIMSNSIRLVRYVFIVLAGIFGMYGQMLALAWLFAHLLNLTSLGSPYMTPIIPRKWTDLTDSVFRAPFTWLFNRSGLSRAKKGLRRPLDEE